MKKIIFAVYLSGRKENTGGHVVLHKLVKMLADMGEEVWINCQPLYECNANIITKSTRDGKEILDLSFSSGKDLVAIYPESVKGNEFKANHIVRWILYHTKSEIEDTWNPTDEYFYYAKGFSTTKKQLKRRMLTLVDAKRDIFYNKGIGTNRKGYCHINKKKYPEGEKMLEYFGSTDLSDFMDKGGFSYLAEQMNKYEYFITYDDATFYSVLAAMCGCKSVVLNPDPRVTPQEFREMNEVLSWGIAYGWNDIYHADMTRDMVREKMVCVEKQSFQQVKEMIRFFHKKLQQNGTPN